MNPFSISLGINDRSMRRNTCRLFILYYLAYSYKAENAKIVQRLSSLPSATSYTMDVDIGSTPGVYTLLVDTGSSNDAVSGRGCCSTFPDIDRFSCADSTTCSETGNTVTVTYSKAGIEGRVVKDEMRGEQLGKVPDVDFVQITQERQFLQEGFEGILGLAYQVLAQPQDAPASSLYNELTKRNVPDVFGMLLCGTYQTLMAGGRPDFPNGGLWVVGGIDGLGGEQYHQGALIASPIIQERWYVTLVTDMGMDGQSFNIPCEDYNDPQAIIDSGTTNLVLSSAIYSFVTDQIFAGIKSRVSNFDQRYMNDEVPCCERYCDPYQNEGVSTGPDLYITFAASTDDDETVTTFGISIPMSYIFRPILLENGNRCRIYGITEGKSTVLGTVFMDGLYIVHDRSRTMMAFGLADNCPNNLQTTKKITPPTQTGTSWCDCLSSGQRSSATVVSFVPFSGQCFFWQWWMYAVLAAFIFMGISAILICCTFLKRRQLLKKAKANENRNNNRFQSQESGPHRRAPPMYGNIQAQARGPGRPPRGQPAQQQSASHANKGNMNHHNQRQQPSSRVMAPNYGGPPTNIRAPPPNFRAPPGRSQPMPQGRQQGQPPQGYRPRPPPPPPNGRQPLPPDRSPPKQHGPHQGHRQPLPPLPHGRQPLPPGRSPPKQQGPHMGHRQPPPPPPQGRQPNTQGRQPHGYRTQPPPVPAFSLK